MNIPFPEEKINGNNKRSEGRKRVAYPLIFIIAFLLGVAFHQAILPQLSDKTENSPERYSGEKNRPDINFDEFWEVWDFVKESYVDAQKVTDEKLYYGALAGIVSSVNDPYSVFLEPELSEEFQDEISGNFQGIGAEIGIRNDQITVISPLPGGPAEKAGLKGGDIIIAIDEADTKDMSLGKAVTLIRGDRGTKVALTIYRRGEDLKRDIIITRDKIALKSVEWSMVGNIAHLKLKYFNEDTLADFRAAVNEIELKSPQGFILDLRNNPGGLLRTAIEVSSYWVGADEIVVIEKRRDGSFVGDSASNVQSILRNIPTVALINRGSASGSEIVAGALQDYKAATLVGEVSFGKGSVQDLKKLPDGSSVKLTIAKWLTPRGREIDEKGILPDIEVALSEEDWNAGRDPQLNKALEVLRGKK